MTSTGWVTFAFSAPFNYDGTNNLMVDFSFDNNNTSGTEGYCRVSDDSMGNFRTLYYQSYNGWYLDPIQWSGDGSDGMSPYPYVYPFFPNLRFVIDTLQSVAIAPTVSGTFVNGVWSGSINVAQVAQRMELTATDALGHWAGAIRLTCR